MQPSLRTIPRAPSATLTYPLLDKWAAPIYSHSGFSTSLPLRRGSLWPSLFQASLNAGAHQTAVVAQVRRLRTGAKRIHSTPSLTPTSYLYQLMDPELATLVVSAFRGISRSRTNPGQVNRLSRKYTTLARAA